MTLAPTISRYFATRFVLAVAGVVSSIFVLVALVGYFEMARRTADVPGTSPLEVVQAAVFAVPQIIELLLPFCVLVGAMAAFLNLSRRLELVIVRAAGLSAWQFTAPCVVAALMIGTLATTVYNPLSATLYERAKLLEQDIFNRRSPELQHRGGALWARQRTAEGQAIINASSSRAEGRELSDVTILALDGNGGFLRRIDAAAASLDGNQWRLQKARIYTPGTPPQIEVEYSFPANLTPDQLRGSFSSPDFLSFWKLPEYIATTESAGLPSSAYRFQFQKLVARPFLMAALVLLAAAFSLRFFRFGGVQKMILGGIGSGFLLYVIEKITQDLSRADLMNPFIAAWLPATLGGLGGFLVLLHQEDG